MKFIKILILTFLIPLFAFTTAHKFYVSVTQIEYVEDKESVQVIMRIFIEDLEKLLQERYDETIILNESETEKEINSYIEKYLATKLNFKINSNDVNFNFLGKEYEDDIVFCYLEINNVSQIDNFEITNNLFFELFSEQQNIIKTKIKSKNKSFLLTTDKNTAKLHFN